MSVPPNLTGLPFPELRGAAWRKSSHSGDTGDCVEVAGLPEGRVAMRDSKNLAGPCLVVTPAEWTALTASVKKGSFDLS